MTRLGTDMVVADLAGMTTLAATPQGFLDLPVQACHDHRRTAQSCAGSSRGHQPGRGFPSPRPGLEAGTVRAGWEGLPALDTAFERAVYMMFLFRGSPFDDGNGCVARVMMNAEAASATVKDHHPDGFRDDYRGGPGALNRQGDSSVPIKALRYGMITLPGSTSRALLTPPRSLDYERLQRARQQRTTPTAACIAR